MSTYKQRIEAAVSARATKLANLAKEELERTCKMSLSAEECYQAGYERGKEDGEDNYTGAIERRSLGDDYAYPEEYRQGYRDGYFQG